MWRLSQIILWVTCFLSLLWVYWFIITKTSKIRMNQLELTINNQNEKIEDLSLQINTASNSVDEMSKKILVIDDTISDFSDKLSYEKVKENLKQVLNDTYKENLSKEEKMIKDDQIPTNTDSDDTKNNSWSKLPTTIWANNITWTIEQLTWTNNKYEWISWSIVSISDKKNTNTWTDNKVKAQPKTISWDNIKTPQPETNTWSNIPTYTKTIQPENSANQSWTDTWSKFNLNKWTKNIYDNAVTVDSYDKKVTDQKDTSIDIIQPINEDDISTKLIGTITDYYNKLNERKISEAVWYIDSSLWDSKTVLTYFNSNRLEKFMKWINWNIKIFNIKEISWTKVDNKLHSIRTFQYMIEYEVNWEWFNEQWEVMMIYRKASEKYKILWIKCFSNNCTKQPFFNFAKYWL